MFLLGGWRNFQDLEENLSLPEIKIILETQATEKEKEQIFLASLQGIDMKAQAHKARYKEVEERAKAKISGGADRLEAASLADLGMIIEEGD